jgi:hypothetical protein
MGKTVAIGSDGSCTLPTGYNAELNTWSATVTRATSVVTGFGDAGTSRVASKIFDITGSAGDASNTSPISTFAGASGANGGTIILLVAGSDGASDECSFEFNAVFSSISLGSTQDGEATVTFNFEMAQDPATAPTFTWYEA